ncbi:MAG: periplasmic heavy metal sensor [Pseudomonadota bacterium]
MIWALVASVSCNLLVAGLWAGNALRSDDRGRRAERVLLRMLPEEHHERWRAEMTEAGPTITDYRMRMSSAHREIAEAIEREPFEVDALVKAFETRRSLSSDLRAMRHQRLVQMTADMSTEQRRIFAERLSLMARRWEERRKLPPPGER